MTKEEYKEILGKYVTEISELKEKVSSLETELYFCHRNNQLEKAVGDNNG